MEKIKNDDGFNVVVTQCDACGKEIANLDEAQSDWLTVEIKSLSRDEWSLDEDSVTRHFCTPDCFHEIMSNIDPHQELLDENSDRHFDEAKKS
jgi:hypothetical protein